ncbi:MAG: BACON domain-containing protein [Bacteroidales bacterium]|nr:BACON domain-containing protein [Bacteroidales bacterium]
MMNPSRIVRLLLPLFLAAGLLLSCRPELDYVDNSFHSDAATLSESGETISVLFRSEAGSASLDLTASGSWKAEFVNGRAYWCTLSQSEGKRGVATLTFTVLANGEYDERSAAILFTCGKLQRTIVVTQKQHDALLLSSDRVELSADGGSFTVEVQSNIDFSHRIEADGSDWIRTVSTKGLEKSALTFSVDPNTSLDRRVGTVSFEGVAGQELVKVYQKGEIPTIVISEDAVGLPAEEGTFKVEVASNLDVELQLPDECTWLKEIQTKTMSTCTYQFSYVRNHTRSSRACDLIFRNAAFSKADTVHVVQQEASILLSSRELFLPSQGDEICIHTSEPVADPALFHFDASWLELKSVEPDADGNCFHFLVRPNPTDQYREVRGEIFRPGFDEPEPFILFQFGQHPSLTYTTTRTEVTAPEMRGVDSPVLILWGDGTYELCEEGKVHAYGQSGSHTIRIEALSLPFLLVPSPENGMSFDFSGLREGKQ